ncbi:MAG: hypothetical protein AAF429_12475 [Pseudomonadota bacterium]
MAKFLLSLVTSTMVLGSTIYVSSQDLSTYQQLVGKKVSLEGFGLSSKKPWKSEARFRKCKKSEVGICFGKAPVNKEGLIITWTGDNGSSWYKIWNTSSGLKASHGFLHDNKSMEEDENVKVSVK